MGLFLNFKLKPNAKMVDCMTFVKDMLTKCDFFEEVKMSQVFFKTHQRITAELQLGLIDERATGQPKLPTDKPVAPPVEASKAIPSPVVKVKKRKTLEAPE